VKIGNRNWSVTIGEYSSLEAEISTLTQGLSERSFRRGADGMPTKWITIHQGEVERIMLCLIGNYHSRRYQGIEIFRLTEEA